jgi:hypothetical protein
MKDITMIPVTSSQIAAIGHDPETNTLAIRFPTKKDGVSGSLYTYSNFTADDFAKFQAAESKGSYFIRTIKPAVEKWPYKKVVEDDKQPRHPTP